MSRASRPMLLHTSRFKRHIGNNFYCSSDLFSPLQNLLELKDRFDSFLNNSFSNDKFFKQVSLFFNSF